MAPLVNPWSKPGTGNRNGPHIGFKTWVVAQLPDEELSSEQVA